MRSHNKQFFFLILLFIFHSIFLPSKAITLSNPSPPPKPPQSLTLIQKTCKKSSETDPNLNYEFCEAALWSAAGDYYSNDLRRLGLLAIRLSKHNATATKRFAKRLISKKDKKLEPYVRVCLRDCMELYADASQTIKEAIVDYKGKRYDDVGFAMSSVIDAATTCEDGFSDENVVAVVVSPLTKLNSDVFQLAAISLSIVNMLNVA